MIAKLRNYALIGFIFFLGVAKTYTLAHPDTLFLVNLGAFGMFLLSLGFTLQSIKNTKIQPLISDEMAGFIQLKTAISFYIFLKNQIEYACKTELIVSDELSAIFENFLAKKLQVLESLLQKVNQKEKHTLYVWVFYKNTNIFPEELMQLLDQYDIKKPAPIIVPPIAHNLPPQDGKYNREGVRILYKKKLHVLHRAKSPCL